MKSLIDLTRVVIAECGTTLCTSTTRDINTVTRRLNTEGESFLTITLPSFCKSFEEALERGHVLPTDFPSFKKCGRSGRLPAFLQGFVELVFDRETGRLLNDVSIEAIRGVRQICLLHSKLFEQASPKRTKLALLNYVQCEKEVKDAQASVSETLKVSFRNVSHLLFGDLFLAMDRIVFDLDASLVPKYGPGATAERLKANQRWSESGWTSRLESVFPMSVFKIPNEKHYKTLDQIQLLEPGAETPVRVITVPKTQKTPRIIAIEPAHNMYVQQALMGQLVERLESSTLLGDMIGFTDQTPNQRLAKLGSETGSLATLDLSEASDRVSVSHVEDLLFRHRLLLQGVLACRSQRAELPSGEILTLAKFASMGSALTFPIEAMVFLTAIFVGISKGLNRQLRKEDIEIFRPLVRVYGDDIIVPVECVHRVIETLEALGFKVNSHKSFWNGRFRESCGKEYYQGHDVTVTKCRRRIPESRGDAHGIQSLVSLRNQLYWKGYWQTVSRIDKKIAILLNGYFPIVEPTSPGLGRESVLSPQGERIDDRLQQDQVRAWVPKQKIPVDSLDGIHALTKCLTLMAGRRDSHILDYLTPVKSEEHLERSGRPEKTILTLRWCSPF